MNGRRPASASARRAARNSTNALLARLSPAGRRELLDRVLARDFGHFVTKVFDTVSPGDEFLPNWHIDAMVYAADGVIMGKTKRLITTVPPRHLKSIIFSVALPAFLLGLDPTKRIICVSYSNDLAVKHANDFRAVNQQLEQPQVADLIVASGTEKQLESPCREITAPALAIPAGIPER